MPCQAGRQALTVVVRRGVEAGACGAARARVLPPAAAREGLAHPLLPSASSQNTSPCPGRSRAGSGGERPGKASPAVPAADPLGTPPPSLPQFPPDVERLGETGSVGTKAMQKQGRATPLPLSHPFAPPQEQGVVGVLGGDLLSQGRWPPPAREPPPARTEKKSKLGEAPSETGQGGSEAPPGRPPPAAPRPPLPPGWVSSRQPWLPRTCLHTFVYRRTYKKAGKANTASPSSPRRHHWSWRRPGRTG